MIQRLRSAFLRFHATLKRFVIEVLLRRVIIPITLLLIYFFAIGTTAMAARLLGKTRRTKPMNENTYWVRAEGYDETQESAYHQS